MPELCITSLQRKLNLRSIFQGDNRNLVGEWYKKPQTVIAKAGARRLGSGKTEQFISLLSLTIIS
jgi:hypothetical protein